MDTVEDFLEHVGVKGMKWGVRKAETPRQQSFRKQARAEKKQSKVDRKEWKKNATSSETANAAFQDAAKTFGPVAKKINNDPMFKGKDLNADSNLARIYDETMNGVFNQHLAQASVNRTLNKAGDRAFIYQLDRTNGMMRATEVKRVDDVQHADAPAPDYPNFRVIFDALGQVSRIVLDEEDELQQADDLTDFLAHYGVKGMKWGVRRSEKQLQRAAPSAVKEKVKPSRKGAEDIRVKNKAGGRVTAKGGRRNVATADAVTAAVNRQKAKASTTNALTNKELKATVERMDLEIKFNKLTKEDAKMNRGKKFVEVLLKAATGDVVGAATAAASGTTTTARRAATASITSGPRIIDM